jgi:hypothetical protein
MISCETIVTGEKIQQLCDIYCGLNCDFYYNLNILNQDKYFDLNLLNNYYDNPYKIFCYGHRIDVLSTKIHFFKNKFILVTHNSDEEIIGCRKVLTILQCLNLEKWYAQNILFIHHKLSFLPIGLANSQWPHGNLTLFNNHEFINSINMKPKTQKVYFNFNINTNPLKRNKCYYELKDKLEWLNDLNPIDNLKRLKEYEFCICPEGNGCDTHRLWEALNLKTVPIVIKSKFTDILVQYNIPLVILNTWSDLDINKLNYNNYNFNDEKFVKLITFTPTYL